MNVKAVYREGISQFYTKPVYQYDEEVGLAIEGLSIYIPLTVEISNSRDHGNAVRYTASQIPFTIPKEFLESGDYVYVWVHSAVGIILVVIPVIQRPVPVDAPDGAGKIEYTYDSDSENLTFLTEIGPILKNNTEDE